MTGSSLVDAWFDFFFETMQHYFLKHHKVGTSNNKFWAFNHCNSNVAKFPRESRASRTNNLVRHQKGDFPKLKILIFMRTKWIGDTCNRKNILKVKHKLKCCTMTDKREAAPKRLTQTLWPTTFKTRFHFCQPTNI